MKVMRIYGFISIILAFGLMGCDSLLDKNPLDCLSTETFWKTESDAKLALTGVYQTDKLTGSTTVKTIYDLWNQDTYLRFFEASTDNGFDKDYNGLILIVVI